MPFIAFNVAQYQHDTKTCLQKSKLLSLLYTHTQNGQYHTKILTDQTPTSKRTKLGKSKMWNLHPLEISWWYFGAVLGHTQRNGSTSKLIQTAFITQLIHSFHSRQINKYLHRVVYSGTQESKAWIHCYKHAICMSIIPFLKRSKRDQAICTTEAAAEQGVSTNRAASRHKQRMHMPTVAHFQSWHFCPRSLPPKSNDNILLVAANF
jgi:hypothetical protein